MSGRRHDSFDEQFDMFHNINLQDLHKRLLKKKLNIQMESMHFNRLMKCKILLLILKKLYMVYI